MKTMVSSSWQDYLTVTDRIIEPWDSFAWGIITSTYTTPVSLHCGPKFVITAPKLKHEDNKKSKCNPHHFQQYTTETFKYMIWSESSQGGITMLWNLHSGYELLILNSHSTEHSHQSLGIYQYQSDDISLFTATPWMHFILWPSITFAVKHFALVFANTCLVHFTYFT